MPTFSGQVDIIRTVQSGTEVDSGLGPSPLIRLDGDTADIAAGGNGLGGDIRLRSHTNQVRVHLEGNSARLWLGGNGADGDIILFPSSADSINDLNQATIHLDGQSGDISLLNADCAEDFDVSASASSIEPGTVVVFCEEGRLRPSSCAYDRKVAGVVSGARGLKPGIVLGRHRQTSPATRLPVALVGKVFCKVDSDYSAIEIGDLLTTSDTPGHAMKATNARRAFGAVIGKALSPLSSGRQMIPILIALQ